MSECHENTLSASVDEFLINRQIDKKKNYASYLTIAKRSYQKLFWNTLWQTQGIWQTVKAGTPYNYIDKPKDCARLFTISIEDRHHKIQPLFYNSQIEVIPKPKQKSCGCNKCDCAGLCDDLNSTTVTTKYLFTVNNIDYYERDWIKLCSNGDVIKWKEIPAKKYNDMTGQSGDFNDDYNNDFLQGNPGLVNFEVVTQTFQEKICALEIAPCGCPVDTPQNVQLITDHCSCFFHGGIWRHHHHRETTFLDDINSNHYGSVKLSECGTKIYYIPPPRHHHHHIEKIPDFLFVNYQSNGIDCSSQVLVPDFALDALWTDIDYRSKRFNSKYNSVEKRTAKEERDDEVNKLILFLNSFNLQELANTQDVEIKW